MRVFISRVRERQALFFASLTARRGGVSSGFTLIELLIALAISAVIASVLYTFLGSVLKNQDQATLFSADMARLQKALIIMQRDIEQVVNRNARDSYGDPQPALLLRNGDDLELIRTGWSLPPFIESRRSELQRVRYQVRDSQLVRTHWRTPDITGATSLQNPIDTVLLPEIEGFDIQVVGVDGAVSDRWPPESALSYDAAGRPVVEALALPELLQVAFEHPRFGKLKKVFRLVGLPETPKVGSRSEEDRGNVGADDAAGEPDALPDSFDVPLENLDASGVLDE